MPAGYYWTTHELQIINTHYPVGGINATATLIPRRTPEAIQGKANRMGVKAPKRSRWPAARYTHTEFTDAIIRAAYTSPDKGAIKAACRKLGWPRDALRDRASRLGISFPKGKEPAWTRDEDELVQELAHLTPKSIAGRLKRAGFFPRTETAVKVRMHRIGISQREEQTIAGIYSTHQAGDLLGVSSKVIGRAIKEGKLRATRPGARNGGDPARIQYRVTEAALKEWIVNHPFEIDLRKAHNHRTWFINLLAGR